MKISGALILCTSHSLVFCATDSSCLNPLCLWSLSFCSVRLLCFAWVLPSIPWPGRCFHAVSLGNCRFTVYFACFPSLKDNSPVLPVVQYLNIVVSNILPSFLVFYHSRIGPVSAHNHGKNLKFQDCSFLNQKYFFPRGILSV